MRVTQGTMLHNSLIDGDLTDETTPFHSQQERYKRDIMCIVLGFIITNGISFITGYLVKDKFMNDDCLDVCSDVCSDGSL